MKSKNKSIIKNLIKWSFICVLLFFAYYLNRDFMNKSIKGIKYIPTYKILICLFLSNIYFIFEGMIISIMTSGDEAPLTIEQGITCSYMCAFYRLATLGSSTAIAQLYYYNIHDIRVSRASGMAMSQYTFQKTAIGIMGIAGFISLYVMNVSGIVKYTKYVILGVLVITFVCAFLCVITVSSKVSELVMFILKKLIKPHSRFFHLVGKAEESITNLQTEGRKLWKDKRRFSIVVLLNLIKFTCWYSIPAVLFLDEVNGDFVKCVLMMMVVNMLGCVMIAPSGIGTLDYVFSMLFITLIPSATTIATTIILYRLFIWFIPFIIGLIPAVLVHRKTESDIELDKKESA